MLLKNTISPDHPIRDLFREALNFGLKITPPDKDEIAEYIEDQILCEFISAENLYRIRDASGKKLEDIADMLLEGNVLLNANSFEREFHVHKHIGDYTLFMLSMFPSSLVTKKGKEFILGKIVIPDASLSEHYMIQGQRSYRIAAEFSNKELFQELASNFSLYKNILELVRIYLESAGIENFTDSKKIIAGTA
ncbi:MAG: hypothetical protein AMK71_05470 [Nitrospira bacterium SG8_35_4]|nr:MAG: hypothetical protein AMK71_05470 [Nitrospira bacterium SG8_35_4]